MKKYLLKIIESNQMHTSYDARHFPSSTKFVGHACTCKCFTLVFLCTNKYFISITKRDN